MSDERQIPPIIGEDLPGSFQAADRGAMQAKTNYLRAYKIDLTLILVGAISTSWAIESTQGRTILALLGALSLGLGLVVSLYLKISNTEQTWFSYRAVAESVKTISWRYMTKATPFGAQISPKEADLLFVENLGEILRMPRTQHATLAGEEAAHDQITDRMRLIREQSLDLRKTVYVRDRIVDEQGWYTMKAQRNAQRGSRLLAAVILFQAIAMAAAIMLVGWADFNFNFASVFSAAAAILIAWLELERHQELAYAYAQAAHELGLILARQRYANSEDELSRFVSDAENAISREHTMWLARRDHV